MHCAILFGYALVSKRMKVIYCLAVGLLYFFTGRFTANAKYYVVVRFINDQLCQRFDLSARHSGRDGLVFTHNIRLPAQCRPWGKALPPPASAVRSDELVASANKRGLERPFQARSISRSSAFC